MTPFMRTIRAGIVGVGKIGRAQIAAVRSIDFADVAAIAMRDPERAAAMASELKISTHYRDYRDLVADPDVDVVHVCTPNSSHFEICKAAIVAGKAVLCEKPLTISAKESEELLALAISRNVKTAVNFVYRHYAAIQALRDIISRGALGDIYTVHGEYLQDWLLYDSDYDWRVESSVGGASRAMADIGSHWCDLACFLTGEKIVEVCADLATFLPRRRRPGGRAAGRADTSGGSDGPAGAGQFAGAEPCDSASSLVDVDTEDYGSALLRFAGGIRGCCTVSQVSAGGRTGPSIQADGSKASAQWSYGNPELLVIRKRHEPDTILEYSNPVQNRLQAQKAMIESFYSALSERASPGRERLYADFADGHHSVEVVEAMMASSRSGHWERL